MPRKLLLSSPLGLISKFRRHIQKNKMIYKIFGFIGLTSFLTGWLELPWYAFPTTAAIFGFCFYVASGGWKFLRNVYLTIGRDLRAAGILIGVKRKMFNHKGNRETIPSLFSKVVAQFPNKVALISADTGESLTFTQLDAMANQIGNFFSSDHCQENDPVALFMESSPEFVCYWLGLAKVGTISALINFNLKGDSLIHCIKLSNAKTLVYSEALAEAIFEVSDSLEGDVKLYCTGKDKFNKDAMDIQNLLLPITTNCPPIKKKLDFYDKLFYIYTSGTTGLPKAAVILHARFFMMAKGLGSLYNITSEDIIYVSLPLYHSNGGILGIGQTILTGSTAVIRKKFSASKFFEDCQHYEATVANYIGETCRYLLAQPQREIDTKHKLRLAFGNGLRPQIWEDFKNRFNIKQIGEFYGSTEGNASVLNTDNKTGAVGFKSIIAPWFIPVKLIKVNEETGELLRGSNGLAVECGYNEPGEIVARIIKDDPTRSFDGYLNSDATCKKIAHDVFFHGDSVYLSGDILYQDELGYIFFHDRTGDTFRWKGENVSTAEVESVMSKLLGLSDVVVYGVEVPGIEGKAGMAAISDPEDQVNLIDLSHNLKHALPTYARPVFIRKMKSEVKTTGTFKFQKSQLRKEGFAPNSVKQDSLYYFDSAAHEYKVLNEYLYKQISNAKLRL